jgi:hypothetical protein
MSKQNPNAKVPMPDEYVEMMQNYMPSLTLAAIKDAWRCNATPLEVIRHYERIETTAHGITGEQK